MLGTLNFKRRVRTLYCLDLGIFQLLSSILVLFGYSPEDAMKFINATNKFKKGPSDLLRMKSRSKLKNLSKSYFLNNQDFLCWNLFVINMVQIYTRVRNLFLGTGSVWLVTLHHGETIDTSNLPEVALKITLPSILRQLTSLASLIRRPRGAVWPISIGSSRRSVTMHPIYNICGTQSIHVI